MSIDKDTARRVAHLARIEVAEADLEPLAAELSGILGFMEQLNEVDIAGVEPMTSVTPMTLPWREDVVTDGGDPRAGARERAGRPRGLLRRAQGRGMSAAFLRLTIAEARERLRSGEIGAVELTEACLAAAEAAGALNAVVGADAGARAARRRRRAAARLQGGRGAGPLRHPARDQGPVLRRGRARARRRRASSRGSAPPYESTVTRRLWEAGAVCIGKLNMDEFAMGSSNETSVYGPAVSPWRRGGDAAR